MPRPRVLLTLMVSLFAVAQACGGCKASAPASPPRPPAEPQGERTAELQGSLLLGEPDDANRYPFTVEVVALSAPGQARYRGCAGVLISSRLVLTAGQCVCRAHQGSAPRVRIDASSCASTAVVVTHMYEPLTHRKGVEAWSVEYQGAVRAHPELELELDEHGGILSRHADLAVIRLESEVQANIPPIRLAEKEARTGERVTVVGHGYIEPLASTDGTRRFSQEQAAALLGPAEDSVPFGSPDVSSYKGDTGGPCLRETVQGMELLGISGRGMGRPATFTSTPRYRQWLAAQ